jgi:hypothetical protein
MFFTLILHTCHMCLVVQRATSQQLHTNGIFFVVHCLLFMVALQIPMPQSVKSRSIKQPSITGVQTLITFLCSRSFYPGTTPPLCHNSTPELIKCGTFCPGMKGIEGSLYCKAVPKSMATRCDPPGHLQTLGVVVDDVVLPPLLCAPWLAKTQN